MGFDLFCFFFVYTILVYMCNTLDSAYVEGYLYETSAIDVVAEYRNVVSKISYPSFIIIQ